MIARVRKEYLNFVCLMWNLHIFFTCWYFRSYKTWNCVNLSINTYKTKQIILKHTILFYSRTHICSILKKNHFYVLWTLSFDVGVETLLWLLIRISLQMKNSTKCAQLTVAVLLCIFFPCIFQFRSEVGEYFFLFALFHSIFHTSFLH